MSIYYVAPLAKNHVAISSAVQRAVPAEDRFQVQGDAGWLVVYSGTSIELSNLLGITRSVALSEPLPETGSAMVLPVTSYYGLGPADMWEWLKTRIESQR